MAAAFELLQLMQPHMLLKQAQQGQPMLALLLLLLLPPASYCMLLLLLLPGLWLVFRCWQGSVCRAWRFNSAVSCCCDCT
jgi:hypothetical protein